MPTRKYLSKQKAVSRRKQYYRWSDNETIQLLEAIIKHLKEQTTWFERPNSKSFYETVKKEFMPETKIDWMVMKTKMLNLRKLYEARYGENENLKEINYSNIARLESICNFKHLLDQIFGPNAKIDPFRSYWNESNKAVDTENTTTKTDYCHQIAATRADATFERFVAGTLAEQSDLEDETNLHSGNELDDLFGDKTLVRYDDLSFDDAVTTAHGTKDLGEKWFQFEKQKVQLNNELEMRRLRLEEKRLKFENEKISRAQRMDKYAIDKHIAAGKLEKLLDKRLKLLEANEDMTAILEVNEQLLSLKKKM